MGSAAAMGVRPARLLRPRSPSETIAFWSVLILSYLALSALASMRGIGYIERVDSSAGRIAFELNPFLWLPDLLGPDPAANPIPVLLWWVLLSALWAEALLVAVHLVRGGMRPRVRPVEAARKSRSM